ncbi:MAG: dephospho-CoA kinase [Acidobacteriota bacterium]|nr:dephospho-CoA kinase [Acidobacteriota bacterium]
MKERRILTVGLTGGIASGKTTVAGFLAREGAHVIDADDIVHELLAPGGAAYNAVVDRFDDVLFEDGHINRELLGDRVFGDAEARTALNRIVHPHVRDQIRSRIVAFRRGDGGPIAVIEAALLVETGAYREYDRLVVARCSRETQLKRLVEREGFTHDEARARVEAQAPLNDKLAVADYVIDTDTEIDETRRQTAGIYSALLEDFESMAEEDDVGV